MDTNATAIAVEASAAQLCGSGSGPTGCLPNCGANRATPYSVSKGPDMTLQHDMFADLVAANLAQADRTSSIETRTKLYISNLDYGISNEDIKVIEIST